QTNGPRVDQNRIGQDRISFDRDYFSLRPTLRSPNRVTARSCSGINNAKRSALSGDLVELKVDQPRRRECRPVNTTVSRGNRLDIEVAKRIASIQNLRKEILDVADNCAAPQLSHSHSFRKAR